jgi:CubicO group peptidase (beta-lactamase class C family)
MNRVTARRADDFIRGPSGGPGLRIVWIAIGLAAGLAVFAVMYRARPGHIRAASADTTQSDLDAIVNRSLKFWQVPGAAVGIVRDGEVIYLGGHGVKRLGERDPVTPDTVFPIASCTKSFTTTALAILADEKKLTWDDPVRRHVPYFHLADPVADADVRLRDLITHRTGLGSNELLWYRSPWSREDIIRRIALVQPLYPFRTHFHYQTTMFTTAGCAIESAAGCPWEGFIHRRLFEPLGMPSSSCTTTAAMAAKDHATPHRPDRHGAVGPIDWYPIAIPEPAGSINSTARDLCRWLAFQLGEGQFAGKRLVSAENLRETHTTQTIIRLEGLTRALNPDTLQMAYGMGWVIQDHRGRLLVSHGGKIDGFRAHLTLLPREGIGIVVLSNLHDTYMNLAVSNKLVDHLLGLSPRDWDEFLRSRIRKHDESAAAEARERQARRKAAGAHALAQADYVGEYQNPAYGAAHVMLLKGALSWSWRNFDAKLEPSAPGEFVLDCDDLGRPTIAFVTDARGVTSLQIMDAVFQKKPGSASR